MDSVNQLKDQIKERLSLPVGLPRLHPTPSAWQEPPHPFIATRQSPQLLDETDIVVIGSGITGCGVVHALLKDESAEASNLRITMLEAREAVSGATGRNGGHLISDSDSLFVHHVQTLGLDEAVDILHFTEANINRLKSLVAQLNPEDRQAVELRTVVACAGFDADMFEEARLNEKSIKDAVSKRLLDSRLISGEETERKYLLKGVEGGGEQIGAAALWPYRLFTAILKLLLSEFPKRFCLETRTPVTAILHTATHAFPYVLDTPRGAIRAKKVIHCTNGYSAYLTPHLVGKLWPLRGTMSRQTPVPSFPRMGDKVSWSHVVKGSYHPETGLLSSGLYYAQQNEHTGDIWVGGEVQRVEDLFTDDDSAVAEIAKENLLSVLPRIWDMAEPAGLSQVWSGIMGFTSDGLPFVGKLTSHMTGRSGEGEWIAAGYSGHGMDKGWLVGEAIAKMMLYGEAPIGFPKSYLCNDERYDRMSAEKAAEGLTSRFKAMA